MLCYERFLLRVTRRKVYRVAAAYIVVGGFVLAKNVLNASARSSYY